MSSLSVLVVDPNPLTHRRVEEALGGLGWKLVSARDAVEAEAQLQERTFNLLLSATSLPRGNGYELARGARQRSPGLAVYLLAGGFEVYNADRARDAGVTGNLPRAFTAAQLRERVAELGPVSPAPEPPAPRPPERPAPTELGDEDIIEVSPPTDFYRPPAAGERVATFLPRDYQQLPLVRVDPDIVGPALERAILEVLPEVVEVVLKRVLSSSSSFRDLVEGAVDEAVRAQLPAIARRVVVERLAEIEARDAEESDF